MESYMQFTNKGEVPINAFKLLGASNKRGDDSKIGFFGTGLKYALAVLLREGVGFRVFSGEKEVKIGTRTTDFLGQKVRVVTVNGEKTSITVDAGIDWEGWFAIREIYSNALDEGGTVDVANEVKGEAGYTKIYVAMQGGKLGDVFSNWQKYFASKRKEVWGDTSRILPKMPGNSSLLAYRKGILAYEQRQFYERSLYDYDLHLLEINESRVAKYTFQVYQLASALVAASANPDVIKSVLGMMYDKDRSDYIEWQNEFWEYTPATFTPLWLELIDDRELVSADYAGRFEIGNNHIVLPDRLIKKLRDFFGKSIKIAGEANNASYIEEENADAKKAVDASLKRLKDLGYDYNGEYKIVVFKDHNTFGQYENGKIMVSKSATQLSENDLDLVLLEEITHHQTGYNDNTRELQTYLFRQLLSMSRQLQKNRLDLTIN